MKVFLGGTCNGSMWREHLISMIQMEYFNPVVEEWTEDCYQEELKQRMECDFCLYVITPRGFNFYSIAEVVDDSNKKPDKTIFCILEQEYPDGYEINIQGELFPYWKIPDRQIYFDDEQLKLLDKVGCMIQLNGGKYYTSLNDVADYLNSKLF